MFYQPTSFYTGQNIQVFSINVSTREVLLFLVLMIKTQLETLSWGGNGATLSRLQAKRILLPALNEAEPDWEYMEQFIVNMMNKIDTPSISSTQSNPIDLSNADWNAVSVGSLFSVKRGNSGPKKNMCKGSTVLIAARKIDNGFDSKVTPPKKANIYKDVLTVNNNGDGGAGLAYYHPYPFIATQDVSILLPKEKISKFSKLFISAAISNQRKSMGFGFGNKLTSKKLERLKIMLPVTHDKQIDWRLMEAYIKSFSNSKLL